VAAGSSPELNGLYLPTTTNPAGYPMATAQGGFSQAFSTQGLPIKQVQAIARLVSSNGVVSCLRSARDFPNFSPTYTGIGWNNTFSMGNPNNWPAVGILGECTVTIGAPGIEINPVGATSQFLNLVSVGDVSNDGISVLDAPGSETSEIQPWRGFVGYLDTSVIYSPEPTVDYHWVDVDISISCIYSDPNEFGVAAFVDLRRGTRSDPGSLSSVMQWSVLPYDVYHFRTDLDDNPLIVTDIALAASEYARPPPPPLSNK
jgi:hypothetical protein